MIEGGRELPRPLFRKGTKNQLDKSFQTKQSGRGLFHFSVEERRRQKRNTDYMELLSELDTGQKVISQAKAKQIIDDVNAEFSDLPDSAMPIGIVAACYLGDPYEVHTIDLETGTIEHYKTSEPLPPMLEKARSIAQHPSYAFIEVYPDCLCAVDKNGEVSIVK